MEALDWLQSVVDAVKAQIDTRTLRLATVDPAYSPTAVYPDPMPYPKVTFEGETSLSTEKAVLAGYIPTAGERVVLAPIGTTWVILGSVDPPPYGPPRAKLYLNTAVSASVSGTSTAVQWNTTTTATEARRQQVGHSNSVSTENLTVEVVGAYAIDGGITYAANNTGQRFAEIWVNGAVVASKLEPTPTLIFDCFVPVNVPLLDLNEGDTVSLHYFQNSGGGLNMQAGAGKTYLSLERRSP